MDLRANTIIARIHGGYHDSLGPTLQKGEGLDPRQVLDFSININPYGPSAKVRLAVQEATYDRYPDPESGQLKRKIAQRLSITAENVVVGNGAADLLWTIARAFMPNISDVWIVEPTFCEFKAACSSIGINPRSWQTLENQDFKLDLQEFQLGLKPSKKPSLVYICNPNSPTGAYTQVSEIKKFAENFPHWTIVYDEAFIPLSQHHSDEFVPLPLNVIRVRSLTKEHAIPGLRVGYAVTTPTIARLLEATRPSWSLNSIGEAAAMAALDDDQFITSSRDKIFRDRDLMVASLNELGFCVFPTSSIYVLVKVGDARHFKNALWQRRILVRDCTSYGLPTMIRLCARPGHDRERLVRGMKEAHLVPKISK